MYLLQKFKEIGFGIKHRVLSYLNAADLTPRESEAFLQGLLVPLTTPHDIAQFRLKFEEIIWFTYTMNSDFIGGGYHSDAGWGCMIRTGQMFMASCLRRLFKDKQKKQIYALFAEFEDSPFGIDKIVKLAQQKFQTKPGEWYTATLICLVLKELLTLYQLNQGLCKQLKFIISNQSSLFLQQLINECCQAEICPCFIQDPKMVLCKTHHKFKNSAIITVMNRIGLEYPMPKYLNFLLKLMEMPQFIGILGGKPKKALFIMGKNTQRSLYFLDPHYVRQGLTKDYIEQKQNFGCNSVRQINCNKIDPSIGIGFFIKDEQSLISFWQGLERLKEENSDQAFVYIQRMIPDFIKNQQEPDQIIIENEI